MFRLFNYATFYRLYTTAADRPTSPKTHCVCNSLLSAASGQRNQAPNFQLSHNRQAVGCCRISLLVSDGQSQPKLSLNLCYRLSRFTSHRRGLGSISSIPCGIFSGQSGRHSHRSVCGQLQPHPLSTEVR